MQETDRQQPRSASRWLRVLVALGFLLGLVLLLARLPSLQPRLTREETTARVLATLQRESRAAFIVTGTLDMTVTTRVRNVRRLLPGLLDVSLGTVESTVRAPGRVSYGFDVSALDARQIRIAGDTVELKIPQIRVYAVEPALERMEVQTRSGWLRARQGAEAKVQQRATALLVSALRRQAEQHIADSEQPRIHSAETLAQLLRPVLVAAGYERPVFRFIINEQLIHQSDTGRRR